MGKISDLEFIEPRGIPKYSYETADALIFLYQIKFLFWNVENLIQNGIGKKNFSVYTWYLQIHGLMYKSYLSKVFVQKCTKSHNLLPKAVSIPISMYK